MWGIQQTLGNFYDDDSSMFVLDSAWHVGSKTFEYAVTRRAHFSGQGKGGGGVGSVVGKCGVTEDSKTVSYADTAIDLVFGGRYLTAGDIDVSCFKGPCWLV